MNRRDMLKTGAAAAVGLSAFPFGWTRAADDKKKSVMMFTRSQAFEHSVVKRGKDNELSLAENDRHRPGQEARLRRPLHQGRPRVPA